MPPSPLQDIPCRSLPPILHVQLDNCWKNNKSRYVMSYWSLLVAKGIFRETHVSFLLVGHTHEDIDALFGRWSQDLYRATFFTLPSLMKSFMICGGDKPPIPHLVEEVPDFKAFIKGYALDGAEELSGHTRVQLFKFYVDGNGWPVMQFKAKCTNSDWSPEGGIKMWKDDGYDHPKLPLGMCHLI